MRFILSILLLSVCYGTTINVPSDSTTIQAGINGAEEGDTVLVVAGAYSENIIWPATNGIKLIGSGEDDCFIDGDSLASVIRFEEDLDGIIDSTTLITGFTIQNGYAQGNNPNYSGGGMFLSESSPTLTRVTFSGNSADYGGGMRLNNSEPTLKRVTFSGNTAQSGGGVFLSESSPTLTRVTFSGNTADYGGGMNFWGSSPTLTRVTFSGNSAGIDGGGMHLNNSSNPTLTNSILWDNLPQEIYFSEILTPSSMTITYSDIQGGEEGILNNGIVTQYIWGDGNIDEDPIFTDPENGDYTLQAGSPCIDAGDPESEPDPDDTIADMGAYPAYQGCTGESSCNYDSNATVDDGSCLENDCVGECGGSVVVDECGVCNGDGSSCSERPLEFVYNHSSSQAFYYVTSIKDIYGNELTEEDWVAAFNGDVCVGSRNWDTSQCLSGICDVPAVGDDGYELTDTNGYLNPGEEPTFMIYDASEGAFFPVFPQKNQNYGFSNTGVFNIDKLMITKPYSIDLHEYVNLISFYNLPEDNSVSLVMQDIMPNILSVQGLGVSSQYFVDGDYWAGTLQNLNISSGYWVRMDDINDDSQVDHVATLSGSGFPYNVKREYTFHTGANLVSFPSEGSFDIASALPTEAAAHIQAIISEGEITVNNDYYEIEDSLATNNGAWTGSLDKFEGLRGYWMFSDATFSFSYNLGPANNDGGAREAAPTQMAKKPAGLHFAQSSEQAFYFVDESAIQEEIVQNGDWLVSFCGSVMAGSRQYLGEATDIPVMGYDGHHSTAGYCESGDTPQFKLFKPTTGEMIDLYSDAPAWTSNGIFFLDNVAEAQLIPDNFSMLSAYPNPFNPVTKISYVLLENTQIKIEVFDISGKRVNTLINEFQTLGNYSINWNALSQSTGIYFLQLQAGKYVETKKVTYIK